MKKILLNLLGFFLFFQILDKNKRHFVCLILAWDETVELHIYYVRLDIKAAYIAIKFQNYVSQICLPVFRRHRRMQSTNSEQNTAFEFSLKPWIFHTGHSFIVSFFHKGHSFIVNLHSPNLVVTETRLTVYTSSSLCHLSTRGNLPRGLKLGTETDPISGHRAEISLSPDVFLGLHRVMCTSHAFLFGINSWGRISFAVLVL